MKYQKSNLFAVLLLLSAMIFAGCESSTDPVKPVVKEVNAPTNLMATSLSDTEIAILFAHSTSKDSSFFKDYYVTIAPGVFDPVSLDNKTNQYTFKNLSKDTEYTITVVARNTELKASSKIEIKWATATRFETNVNDDPIKIYEYTSDYGSGLVLFDAEGFKPKTLTVGSKDKWNIGIDTRDNKLLFGSSSKITFGSATPTNPAEVGTKLWFANSLNEVYDSEALNEGNNQFNETVYDLNDADFNDENNRGLVLILRVKDGSDYNYAKILIKRDSQGNLLQGPDGNRYLECIVSYQTGKNLPYAK